MFNMKILYTIIYFGCVFAIPNVFGANTTDDRIDTYDESQPYCFQFTWIGPDYDNKSVNVNFTCGDYLDATRAVNIPCRSPLVYTYDGSPPNVNFLWENHRTTVLCRRSRGSVCAKYSFSYNNDLQNVTYMCTKAFVVGEGPITSGCFKQIVNEYEVELCVCKSETGPYKPCNAASTDFISVGLVIILTFLAIANNILEIHTT